MISHGFNSTKSISKILYIHSLDLKSPPFYPTAEEMKTIALAGDIMIGRLFNHILSPNPQSHSKNYTRNTSLFTLHPELQPLIETPLSERIFGERVRKCLMDSMVRLANFEGAIQSIGTAKPRSRNQLKKEKYKDESYVHLIHPHNLNALKDLFDILCLANNHALDAGPSALQSSLPIFSALGVAYAGVGNAKTARQKVIVGSDIFSVGVLNCADHFAEWAATRISGGIGINYFDIGGFVNDNNDDEDDIPTNHNHIVNTHISSLLASNSPIADINILSVHWGDNFCWSPPLRFREFAKTMMEKGNFDVVFGHSSHHIQGIEVLEGGRIIIYGSGDFLNDYDVYGGVYKKEVAENRNNNNDDEDSENSENEGEDEEETKIFDYGPFAQYHSDLGFLYLLHCRENTLELERRYLVSKVELVPTRIRGLKVDEAEGTNRRWVMDKMIELSSEFGTKFEEVEGRLVIDVEAARSRAR